MKGLVFILIIQYVCGQNLTDMDKINNMEYSYESIVIGEEAEFIFIIFNTTYATKVLEIERYYFSTTFIDEKLHEKRSNETFLLNNETRFDGVLKMENLEEKGNYLVCVIFLTSTSIITSSRFCHVVSVSHRCNLEISEATFGNRHVFVLLGFVVVIFTVTVLFTFIRDYIYRPQTIEAIMKTLPEHHAENLETLAPTADNRRRRRTQQDLNNRLREDSVLSVDYTPNADNEYMNYYGIDNASLDTLPE